MKSLVERYKGQAELFADGSKKSSESHDKYRPANELPRYGSQVGDLSEAFLSQAERSVPVTTEYLSSIYKDYVKDVHLVIGRSEKSSDGLSEYESAVRYFRAKTSSMTVAQEAWIAGFLESASVPAARINALQFLRGFEMKIAASLVNNATVKSQFLKTASDSLDSVADFPGDRNAVMSLLSDDWELKKNASKILAGGENSDAVIGTLFSKSKSADLWIADFLSRGKAVYNRDFVEAFQIYKVLASSADGLSIRVQLKNRDVLFNRVTAKFLTSGGFLGAKSPGVRNALYSAMSDSALRGVRTSANYIREVFGLSPVKVVELSQSAKNKITNRINTLVRSLDKTSKNVASEMLIRGIESGTSHGRLVAEFNKTFPQLAKYRAQVIVQTETTAAYSHMRQEAARKNGMNRKQWVTRGDSQVCKVCQLNEGQGEIKVGELFLSGHQKPPCHVQDRCVVFYGFDLPQISKAGIMESGFSAIDFGTVNPYCVFVGKGYEGRDAQIFWYLKRIKTVSPEMDSLVHTNKDGKLTLDHKAERCMDEFEKYGVRLFDSRKDFIELSKETATPLEFMLLKARFLMTDYGFNQLLSAFNRHRPFKAFHPDSLLGIPTQEFPIKLK